MASPADDLIHERPMTSRPNVLASSGDASGLSITNMGLLLQRSY